MDATGEDMLCDECRMFHKGNHCHIWMMRGLYEQDELPRIMPSRAKLSEKELRDIRERFNEAIENG